MQNDKIPSPICFLEESDRRFIHWDAIKQDREDPNYEASYDFDVDNYELVDTFDETVEYGDEVSNLVVRRKSDDRHFKLRIYTESWDDVYSGWSGSYGEVAEVIGKPVTKMEWSNVQR